MNPISQVVEVKIVGWLQVSVLAAIMITGYLANRAEIRLFSRSNARAVEDTRKQIQQVQQRIDAGQQQQSQFCRQWELDMDRWFREHPEFRRHPWLCDPVR